MKVGEHMKNKILDDIAHYEETIALLSKNGDPDMVAMYEDKLKCCEIELIQELAGEPENVGDVTLIMYRTSNFGIVTPQIARHVLNKK